MVWLQYETKHGEDTVLAKIEAKNMNKAIDELEILKQRLIYQQREVVLNDIS